MEAYQKLEQLWADWNGLDVRGMVACSSGTTALHLALEAMKLPLGSEVITSDFNMIAVPRAIALAGLTPVFVDCDERLLMDAKLWPTALTLDTSAVIFVHIYGRRCEFPDKWVNGDEFDPMVIEDLAEAHGVKPHPMTDAACWSFFANKHVHGEEGGAVWFRDPEQATLARQLRCLGFTSKHDYNHTPRGMNYRLANSLATLILKSITEFDVNTKRMREVEASLDRLCFPNWRMPSREATWVYDFRIPGMSHKTQDGLVTELKRQGIAARHGFKPMATQQEFKSCRVLGAGNAGRLARETIYVPLCDSSLPVFSICQQQLSRVENDDLHKIDIVEP